MARLLPEHEPQRREQLKQSITESGILVPLITDETGNILDGTERKQIAEELGITNFPIVTLNTENLTQKEITQKVFELNCQRRQIGTKAMQRVIDTFLELVWDLSDSWTGQILCVDPKTVHARREFLVAQGKIPRKPLRTKDNRTYKKKMAAVYTLTKREHAQALEDLKELNPEEKPKGNITGKRLKARTSKIKYDRQEAKPVEGYNQEADICPYHCDYRFLAKHAALQPKSIALILTDPLYQEENIRDYGALAKFAQTYLIDGGYCIAYTGHNYLPSVMNQMVKHLTYHWLAVIVTSDQPKEQPRIRSAGMHHHRMMITSNRPVLIMSSGRGRQIERYCPDTYWTNQEKEKEHHEYQQNLGAVQHWLRHFSKPGELVVDPFMGSGTTAVACRRLQRRFVGCDRAEKAYRSTLSRLKQEQAAKPR